MAKFSVDAYVVLDQKTGREQMVITCRVKKAKVSTLMATCEANENNREAVQQYLWKMLEAALSRQGSIYWNSEAHPFQEELPF